MQLHDLPAIVEKTKKRVGRGTSSGRGKTSGRGVKGDKARGTSPWYRQGGSRRSRLLKHLPQVRGIGNLFTGNKDIVISLETINKVYVAGETVSVETLLEKGVLTRIKSNQSIKILSKGTLDKKLTVQVPTSASAKAQIEKMGGSVE
ncbi:MAG: 50S ribosomal protein L15 [bacterium]|nr:50S ribosomal protein L15 [bacterium]